MFQQFEYHRRKYCKSCWNSFTVLFWKKVTIFWSWLNILIFLQWLKNIILGYFEAEIWLLKTWKWKSSLCWRSYSDVFSQCSIYSCVRWLKPRIFWKKYWMRKKKVESTTWNSRTLWLTQRYYLSSEVLDIEFRFRRWSW